LRSRLREQGFGEELVSALVQELIEERLLDDARFAATFVRQHAERGHGPRRIRQELSATGLGEVEIEEALAAAPDFHAICARVRERRFGPEAPRDWQERARQSRFLQYRGWSNDHIAFARGSSGADPPDDPPPDDPEP
jgi:regulatory protein